MGGYKEEYKWGQDGNLWYRMLHENYKFYFIEEPLVSIRINKESVTFKRSEKNYLPLEEIYFKLCLNNHAWMKALYYLNKISFGEKKFKLILNFIIAFIRFSKS